MANEEQLAILKQGVAVWNKWREDNPNNTIDLAGADLRRANLVEVDFSEANLGDANLWRACLNKANLRHANLWNAYLSRAELVSANLFHADLWNCDLHVANLEQADLRGAGLGNANLSHAVLVGADLMDASLPGANLTQSDIRNADLTKADLSGAIFVKTKVDKVKLSGSTVYGISVWDLDGEIEEQRDLVITPEHAPIITVDNIKVAQFIYLLLNNQELRDVINTLTSKTVLILGRFAIPERKAILDALRNKLREYDLLPIVFDFDRPTDKDFTETIKTLAGISYFVIADVTNPKSSPLELQATVPDYQIPFVPIIQEGESPFAMMVDLQKKYNWVLPTRSYDSIETLMKALKPGIIDPAVEMRNKLRLIKAQEYPTESLKDYLDKTL